jgi:hypothetical protein
VEYQLHAELLKLQSWCVAHGHYRRMQELRVIWDVAKLVAENIPGGEVRIFGSFMTGLSTPHSDVDVLVMNSLTQRNFQLLSQAIRSQPWARHVTAVPTAHVPIIKITADAPAVDSLPQPFTMAHALSATQHQHHTSAARASSSGSHGKADNESAMDATVSPAAGIDAESSGASVSSSAAPMDALGAWLPAINTTDLDTLRGVGENGSVTDMQSPESALSPAGESAGPATPPRTQAKSAAHLPKTVNSPLASFQKLDSILTRQSNAAAAAAAAGHTGAAGSGTGTVAAGSVASASGGSSASSAGMSSLVRALSPAISSPRMVPRRGSVSGSIGVTSLSLAPAIARGHSGSAGDLADNAFGPFDHGETGAGVNAPSLEHAAVSDSKAAAVPTSASATQGSGNPFAAALPPLLAKCAAKGWFDPRAPIRLDITFHTPNHRGVDTTVFSRAHAFGTPALAPLVLALKQLLAGQGLNDAFTGGMSSFAVLLMTLGFLNADPMASHLRRLIIPEPLPEMPIRPDGGSFQDVVQPYVTLATELCGSISEVFAMRRNGCLPLPMRILPPVLPPHARLVGRTITFGTPLSGPTGTALALPGAVPALAPAGGLGAAGATIGMGIRQSGSGVSFVPLPGHPAMHVPVLQGGRTLSVGAVEDGKEAHGPTGSAAGPAAPAAPQTFTIVRDGNGGFFVNPASAAAGAGAGMVGASIVQPLHQQTGIRVPTALRPVIASASPALSPAPTVALTPTPVALSTPAAFVNPATVGATPAGTVVSVNMQQLPAPISLVAPVVADADSSMASAAPPMPAMAGPPMPPVSVPVAAAAPAPVGSIPAVSILEADGGDAGVAAHLPPPLLGRLFLKLLKFYGDDFKPSTMAINALGGVYELHTHPAAGISDPLTIPDPLCISNNVGRNCFRVFQVLQAFRDTRKHLLEHVITKPWSPALAIRWIEQLTAKGPTGLADSMAAGEVPPSAPSGGSAGGAVEDMPEFPLLGLIIPVLRFPGEAV